MQIEAIDSKTELARVKEQILALFLESYGTPLNAEVWDWAYIDNVFGDPYVTVCRDAGELVAHYAVIPFFLHKPGGGMAKTYLSMTTMVAPSHRKHGLFVKLAEATYDRLAKAGAHGVIGFPNLMSAPGFAKRLSWSMGPMDYVARLSKQAICEDDELRAYFSAASGLYLNLADTNIRAWRLAKPGNLYKELSGCIVKEYGEGYDLMWANHANALDNLPSGKPIALLIDAAIARHQGNKLFDYQFGGRAFAPGADLINVKKTMALSDVF